MIAIGNYIGIGRQSVSSYWTTQKSLEYTRSGLDLIETYSGDNLNAKILPACARIDATHYMNRTVANFGSGVTALTGGYIETRFYYPDNGLDAFIFASSDVILTTKYFFVGTAGGKLRININNVTPAIGNAIDSVNTLSVGWHTVRFKSVIAPSAHYEIILDGVTLTVGSGLAVNVGSDNGKWIGDVLNRDNITVGYLKRSDTVTSELHLIDYIDFNGTNKWYFTGLSTEYDVVADAHLGWNTNVQYYYPDAGQYYLNTGFSIWKKAGSNDQYVPYTSAGTPYNISAYLVGYTKEADYAGGTYANLVRAPYVVGFNETSNADARLEIFDRSNTTRMEDIARTSIFYDSTSLATKSRFFSHECMQIANIESLYKNGYKHMIFPKNDDTDNPTDVIGFVVTNTDLT